MNQYATMIRNLKSPEVMERLMHLYGRRDGMLVEQTGRYIGLLKRHEELFHENREVLMISAPGRTEIGGNHTDHNRGRVLAAAINLDTLSAVSARDDMMVVFPFSFSTTSRWIWAALMSLKRRRGKPMRWCAAWRRGWRNWATKSAASTRR